MTAAMEREKQILMSRPDILHPIDQKMLELSIDRGHGRSPHRLGVTGTIRTIGHLQGVIETFIFTGSAPITTLRCTPTPELWPEPALTDNLMTRSGG